MIAQLQALSVGGWVLAVVAMLLIGVSRTGFRGTVFLAIPLFATVFGARLSTSVVLIMVMTADVVAVIRFVRSVDWKIIVRLLPWVAIGVVAGTVFGMYMDDRYFGKAIAAIVLLSLVLSVVRDFRRNKTELENKRWLAPPLGVAAGFTSMVGNAAGPLMTTYMLALGLNKEKLLATAAWFFFLLNIFKLPFHIFVWHTISGPSLMVNVVAIAPILLGTYVGAKISGRVSERTFRIVTYVLAAAGSINLLVS